MKHFILLLVCTLCLSFSVQADELNFSMQYIPRAEFRSGYLSPLPESSDPANFIMQRARIGIDYQHGPMQFSMAMQETRVWGQDMSTTAYRVEEQNDGMMIHEAWGKYTIDSALFNQSLSFKFGRQEIKYDDQRLLGNLDWLRQARRHDALIIGLKNDDGSFLDIGLAFNQNAENKTGDYYKGSTTSYGAGSNGIAQMYKSFIYAYYSGTTIPIQVLYFNDNFSRLTDTLKTGETTARHTAGLKYEYKPGAASISASGYYQFGYDARNLELAAYFYDIQAKYTMGDFTFGLLYDFSSGSNVKDGALNDTKSSTFDPLYGTPHKFYGLMDYYYAGSSIGYTGVQDIKASVAYSLAKNLSLNLDIHSFSMTSDYLYRDELLDRNLGMEFDFTTSYKPTPKIKVELGACAYSTTNSLAIMKNVNNIDSLSTFFYLAFRFEDITSLIKH